MALILGASSVIIFAMIRALPGDPAMIYAGQNPTPPVIAALRRSFGLDRPVVVQYWLWLRHMATGDLGHSFVSGFPVAVLIRRAAPNTLELSITSLVFALIVGVSLGMVAAMRPRGWAQRFVDAYSVVALSVPNFWLGYLLIIVFAVHFHILPAGGNASLSHHPLDWAKSIALPAFALGVRYSAVTARYVKTSAAEVLHEDFIRTAYSKGLSTFGVVRHDVVKAVLVPIITITGIELGALLAGAVVIETVFAWPGLGQLLVNSLANRDYGTLQALLLIFVFAFLACSLVADLCIAAVDPRIRLDRSASR